MADPTPPTQNGASHQPNGAAPQHLNGDSTTTTPAQTNGTPPPAASMAQNPAIQNLATRLYTAARTNDLPLLSSALTAGLPPNLTNDKGDTLLMLASYHGHIESVKLLLSWGADPNVVNDRGQSILAGAVFKKEVEVVRLLCEGWRGWVVEVGD